MWLFDEPEPITDRELAVASLHGMEITVALEKQRQEEDRHRVAEGERVRQLIAGEAVSNLGDGLLAMACSYSVIAIRVSGGDPLTSAIERLRRSIAPHCLLALSSGGEAVLVLATDDPEHEPRSRAEDLLRLAEGLAGTRHDAGILIGISEPRPDVHQIHVAHREALWAAACASQSRPVVGWEDLGAYRTILPLVEERPVEMLLPDHIGRLLAAKDSETLLMTLETYLEMAGDASRTASALSLHRSSLWQRLHRIEEVAEVDLRSGDDRLELHLGLRLWHLSRSSVDLPGL